MSLCMYLCIVHDQKYKNIIMSIVAFPDVMTIQNNDMTMNWFSISMRSELDTKFTICVIDENYIILILVYYKNKQMKNPSQAIFDSKFKYLFLYKNARTSLKNKFNSYRHRQYEACRKC